MVAKKIHKRSKSPVRGDTILNTIALLPSHNKPGFTWLLFSLPQKSGLMFKYQVFRGVIPAYLQPLMW